jgi:hypothetical protein
VEDKGTEEFVRERLCKVSGHKLRQANDDSTNSPTFWMCDDMVSQSVSQSVNTYISHKTHFHIALKYR